MAARTPWRGTPGWQGLGGGLQGAPPRDLLILLTVLFATYACQFFDATAVIGALLQLSPAVWERAYLWQLISYPLSGFGPPSFWILLELLVVYWFGRDVLDRLGRRRFWKLLVLASACAGAGAVAVEIACEQMAPGLTSPLPFQLVQGQRVLMVVLLAAFGTLYGDTTVLLFFVVPVKARWFVWLGILLGFVAFLGSKDLAGFTGICTATGFTLVALGRGGASTKLGRWWRERRQARLLRQLERARQRSRLRIVEPPESGERPPTIH
jgi:membrane associated rhomboid family serine protease